jgi:hypothetical protein
MTKRVFVSALCCAMLVFTTGCGDECTDQFDCRNDKGQPAPGQEWICNADNKCEQRAVEQPPEEDAGTGTDAGTDMDAGTDAGMDMDAGTDAGMDMDAGTDAGTTDAGSMSVAKGEACISSGDCMAGLRCEGPANDTRCQAMHIAVTATRDSDGVVKALVTRYDTPEPAALTAEDTSSRYPRWGPGGTRIAFARSAVETEAGRAAGDLVVRDIPLADGQSLELADGGTGNTLSFRYMEWEPGSNIAYVRRNAGGTSGISVVPTDGGAITEPIANGTFPDWKDATTFAYSRATVGLSTFTLGAEAPTPLNTSGGTAEQPHYNRANDQLLFLANPENKSVTFTGDTSATPLPRLYVLPVSGGREPQLIADYTSEAITGGTVESYIANPNWAPDGRWAAFVRAYYFKPVTGDAVLCGGTPATCRNQPGNVIVLRRVDPATGAAMGTEASFVEGATLPSFSPDGRFVAYIQGGELYVQQIDPATGNKVGAVIRHTSNTYTLQTSAGDDHRPRWQPK